MNRGHGQGPSQRQLRVGEEIRHALAWMLERGDVHDPGLAGVAVTVTEVRVSPDLRNATVFITPLGGGDPTGVLQALTRAKSFLRRQIAHAIHLKFAPNLSFKPDDSFDEASHIDALLRRPEVARDLAGHDPEDDDGAA